MKRYAMGEAELGIPEGWLDTSTTTLVYDRPEGELRLLVLRAPTASRSLEEATTRQLADLRRQLPRFELVASEPRTLAGRDATALTVRFSTREGDVYQRIASMLIEGRLVALAVQGAPSQSEAIDALFEQVVSGALPPSPPESP